MKNPFGDQQIPGDYRNIKERLYKNVSVSINDKIFDMMIKAYENALQEENVVLSRPERKRLFAQIMTMLMDDMSKKLD